jgi:hypothetical protein
MMFPFLERMVNFILYTPQGWVVLKQITMGITWQSLLTKVKLQAHCWH